MNCQPRSFRLRQRQHWAAKIGISHLRSSFFSNNDCLDPSANADVGRKRKAPRLAFIEGELCVCRLRRFVRSTHKSVSRYGTLLVSRTFSELLRVLKPNGVVSDSRVSRSRSVDYFGGLVAFIIGVLLRESADS